MGKRNKTQRKQGQRKEDNRTKFKKFNSQKTTGSGINKSSNAINNPNRKLKEGSEGFYRTKATIKRLKMVEEKPDIEARRIRPDKPARIDPNRKWFGNTRTINQKTLEALRREKDNEKHDTYSQLLRKRKLPLSLITTKTENKLNVLHESFKDTFGPNSKRKKPNISSFTMEELAEGSYKKLEEYEQTTDINLLRLEDKEKVGPATKYATAGMSKRIYGELYKVIDSSDVICEVLDARDPMGTRSFQVENHIKKNAPHKHIIFILNKCDLVPTWSTVYVINIGFMG
jgi:nuclear GTP-binding protein